jgi:hypothetical protein
MRFVIRNSEPVIRVPLTSAACDQDRSIFINAFLACFEFVANLLASAVSSQPVTLFAAQLADDLSGNWAGGQTCPQLPSVVRCGFGRSAEEIEFLSDQVIVQTSFSESK